jgi:hypothetical protein
VHPEGQVIHGLHLEDHLEPVEKVNGESFRDLFCPNPVEII